MEKSKFLKNIKPFLPFNLIKAFFAIILNTVGLFLPYKLRHHYLKAVSFFIHLPYWLFGKIAQYMMRKLNIKPRDLLG